MLAFLQKRFRMLLFHMVTIILNQGKLMGNKWKRQDHAKKMNFFDQEFCLQYFDHHLMNSSHAIWGKETHQVPCAFIQRLWKHNLEVTNTHNMWCKRTQKREIFPVALVSFWNLHSTSCGSVYYTMKMNKRELFWGVIYLTGNIQNVL